MKKKVVKRKWYLIDAKGKTLGRMSTEIAGLLMGKAKPEYKRNNDTGDYIVVINCSKVKVTGNKKEQKKYIHHTGFPGGYREIVFNDLINKSSGEIITHAVKGMLPQNKLRDVMLKRLYVYSNETHPFKKNLIKNNY